MSEANKITLAATILMVVGYLLATYPTWMG